MLFSPAKDAAPRTLACIGLEGHIESSLKSLLGILKNRIHVAWHYSENADSDVVIYNPRNALARAILQRGEINGHRHIFIACDSEDPGPDGLTLPLRADRLMSCLESAALKLDGNTAKLPAQNSNLCEDLDTALQTPGIIAVSLSVGDQIGILNPTQKMIHWPKPLTSDVIAQMVLENVTVQPLYAEDMGRLRRLELKIKDRAPWDAPLWVIGVSTSGGRLFSRLDSKRSYRLSRWPDFGLIGRRSSDLKCTALLTHKSMTAQELVAATGISEKRVNGFLNACALCGLLKESYAMERTSPTDMRPGTDTSVAGSMMQRIPGRILRYISAN